jgi:phage FluMu protein Com
MEEFCSGHHLSRIRHCGHVFSQQALQNWLSLNVRCPICRYDIRETTIPIFSTPTTHVRQSAESVNDSPFLQDDHADADADEPDNVLDISYSLPRQNNDTSSTSITHNLRNFSNTLRTFIQQELRNNPTTTELMYTFDIPFGLDLSNNRWIR